MAMYTCRDTKKKKGGRGVRQSGSNMRRAEYRIQCCVQPTIFPTGRAYKPLAKKRKKEKTEAATIFVSDNDDKTKKKKTRQ
jgi:hypothetical protein